MLCVVVIIDVVPLMPPLLQSTTLEDRVRGCVLGLAWGDAYGCPVEGWKAGRIQRVYGDYKTFPFPHYPMDAIKAQCTASVASRLRPLGLYSDDTQQCLALLNCCMNSSSGATRWNVKEWSAALVKAMQVKALRGYGQAFQKAVAKLSRGVSPYQSGSPSEGMGAAMRIGPIGALFRNNTTSHSKFSDSLLAQVAFESALTTHATITAAATAYAVAWAVSELVNGRDAAQVRAQIANQVSAVEKDWLLGEERHPEWKAISRERYHAVSATLRSIFSENSEVQENANSASGEFVSYHEAIRRFLVENARPQMSDDHAIKPHVNLGFVLLGGLHGLVMALLPDIDPQETLREIVVLGHDTDTVAAIAGTVLGARFGTSWIPVHLMREVATLQQYADAIIHLAPPLLSPPQPSPGNRDDNDGSDSDDNNNKKKNNRRKGNSKTKKRNNNKNNHNKNHNHNISNKQSLLPKTTTTALTTTTTTTTATATATTTTPTRKYVETFDEYLAREAALSLDEHKFKVNLEDTHWPVNREKRLARRFQDNNKNAKKGGQPAGKNKKNGDDEDDNSNYAGW
eukprot:TRINITY_DN6548_c1_g1_i1.p1 TRINITY_DN6548_c1_g1~~TRINITY_DN6548_c1_g1_i1.p1  ORF type:complete len:570 (+),score=135.07 TRINITY_DN6548_c1_g1_i1:1505-3214(+)